jgi:sodium-independent sulfate anion transporter 11
VNSFFHVMGVGGAMSRTSVNSACKVKSPLSGIVTTAVILVCIFKLTDVLYWIPKATLAAIIITAVWPLINPPSVFYKFWKTSLADFISAMLAFWVCLFVNTEAGLGAAVGFNIVYVLLRQTFTSVKSISGGDHMELSELRQSLDSTCGMPTEIPDDLRIFRFHESFFFPNAYSVKTTILNNIKTHHSPTYSARNGAEAERIWSVQGERQVARLRKKMKITDPDSLPPANVIVFDLAKCNHLDSTACTQLKQLVTELRLYSGKHIERECGGLILSSWIMSTLRARIRRIVYLSTLPVLLRLSLRQGGTGIRYGKRLWTRRKVILLRELNISMRRFDGFERFCNDPFNDWRWT